MTEQLRLASSHWYSIYNKPDGEVANLIQSHEIDILVDLAGHSADNRINVFALKPAPIQINWLGYPNTTGLHTIDYRFTDSIADPPGLSENLYTEKLVRLPHGFQCYSGDLSVNNSKRPPQTEKGYVTFGSFNNLSKVTNQVLKVW